MHNDILPVRNRATGSIDEISFSGLAELINLKLQNFPRRPLPLQALVSRRPMFLG